MKIGAAVSKSNNIFKIFRHGYAKGLHVCVSKAAQQKR
jgi:hypothetical protein